MNVDAGRISLCLAFSAALVAACVGSSNPDAAEGPKTAADCTGDEKFCTNQCVAKNNPNLGCAAESCTPCVPNPNALAICNAGVCASTCEAGFADCDGQPANGCEARTSDDVQNCGACKHTCGATNTTAPPTCGEGKCDFACKVGFAHCGATEDTGCESELAIDAANCGTCGHSCLGGTCARGKCAPFQLASANSPVALTVGPSEVFFSSSSVPYVDRVGRDGTCAGGGLCPATIVPVAGDSLAQYRGAASLTTDGTTLWFMAEAVSRVVHRPLAGGPLVFFAGVDGGTPPIAGSSGAGNIVFAGRKVFWTNDFGTTDPTPHVQAANPDGTGITTVSTYATPIANFYGPGTITADATSIYWSTKSSGIYKHAFAVTTPCVEDTSCTEIGAPGAVDLAVDDTFLYWNDPGSNDIHRGSKDPGGGGATLATGQTGVRGIAVMDGFVYWSVPGAIRRTAQAGGICDAAACELVTDQHVDQVSAMVVASDGLYWTNGVANGGVYRLAK